MRRGLKPYAGTVHQLPEKIRFKPIPDEEGTETAKERPDPEVDPAGASNRSPMRRGLKLMGASARHSSLTLALQTDPR
jgi:hypothetical protein